MTERMLIIDDEEVVLESCRKIFTAEGFDVVITTSPQEGLKLASDSSFDVILCDWKMPGFDGMDVVEELDRRSPDSAVVMISGYPSVGRAAEAMKRGAMDYVSKPFTPDEITDTVKKAVKRKMTEEKKAMGRFEKIIESVQFPTPPVEDKPPKTIAETVASTVGVSKTTSPWLSVFVLGILAGAYIGFGGLLSTCVTFDLANIMGIGFKKFMAGTAFSVGLILVVVAGAELFTGNNLMLSSAMAKKITFRTMSARWAVVWFANLIGSLILALILYFSGLWKAGHGALGASAVAIAYIRSTLVLLKPLSEPSAVTGWYVWLYGWPSQPGRPLARYSLSTFPSWHLLPLALSTLSQICILFPLEYSCTVGRALLVRRPSIPAPSTGLVSYGRTWCL